MDAIVYTSETGFTAEYAAMLSERTGLKACPLERAQRELKPGASIIYLGWLSAGMVKGYKKAAKRYDICAVCGVGMGENGARSGDVRKANGIGEKTPLYILQGGYAPERLRGMNKFMMKLFTKFMLRELSEKENKTPEELDMLELIKNGGSRVSEKNLTGVLEWYNA